MLKMKDACERCGSRLGLEAAGAFICSFECTFCQGCTTSLNGICPNCSGELVRRPTRTRSVANVATSQMVARVRRLFGAG